MPNEKQYKLTTKEKMRCDICLLILVVLIVSTEITSAAYSISRHQSKKVFQTPRHIENENEVYYGYENEKNFDEVMRTSEERSAKLEVDVLKCPNGCICQYAHFQDLPISRWIGYLKKRKPEKTKQNSEYAFEVDNENDKDGEAESGNYENFLLNPFIKQATCILEKDANEIELVNSLPVDLQALILLYTGIGRNKTINTSALKTLNQLTTLEIRGTQDRTLALIFDEPLRFIQHANFESITLLGSDTFKRPKNPVHPSDSFDYKPKIELYSSYEKLETTNLNATVYNITRPKTLGFEAPIEEVEILPYDIYMEEMKKARMPSFYGWENLEVLRIHLCNLKELYWEMFDGLSSLQHLSLERNNIVAVPAFALYGALHIKTLSLAHNHIHDLHYRALAGLLELEMLDLSDNQLGKLSELSFPPFPKLEHADFRNNPLRYIFPAAFWVMNGTRTMHLDSRGVALELRPNEPFDSLKELLELSIENISVSNLEQNIFKGLHSLKKMKLRGKIPKIDFDSFAGLIELQELILSHCGIHEISMDALIGVRKLQVLDLSYNNITYIPPGLFDDQAGLIEIYLQGNQLNTLPYTFFLQPKLRLAHLNNNPWECSCNMANWRSKVTNQVRGNRSERCISDFQTGKKIACRRVNGFKFDKSLTPRCDNYNGRSVFYVLRKQLRCGGGKLIYRQPKHHNNKEMQHNKRFGRRNHRNGNENKIPEISEIVSQKRINERKPHILIKETNWEEIQRHGQNKNTYRHTDNDQEISNEI